MFSELVYSEEDYLQPGEIDFGLDETIPNHEINYAANDGDEKDVDNKMTFISINDE